jgi:hypothetical protein
VSFCEQQYLCTFSLLPHSLMQAPSSLKMSITDTQTILNELSWDPITTVYKPNYSNFKSHTFQNCFPWLSSDKWYQICEALKNYINQTDLRKACYNKLCSKSGENKWSHCLPQSLTNTFISLHDFILFPGLYLKTKTIQMDWSNTQTVNYNVMDAK